MARSFRPSTYLVVFVVVVIGVIVWPSARSFAGRSLIHVSRPLVVVGYWVGDQLHLTPGRSTMNAQRQQLEQQVKDLTSRLYEANLLLESSQVVDKISNFTNQTHHHVVMANVTTTSPDPGIQSIVIDRGSDDGVAIGDVAVTDNGLVVGKVVNVRQVISTILLLSDRQSVLAARLQNTTQSSGVIRGQRGLTLEMEFIPRGDTVQAGQTIVTSGTEASVPPDLLIGSVTSTVSRSGDLFQQATVTPAAQLQRLRIVGIILP